MCYIICKSTYCEVGEDGSAGEHFERKGKTCLIVKLFSVFHPGFLANHGLHNLFTAGMRRKSKDGKDS